jgi:CspA family cold shock protein
MDKRGLKKMSKSLKGMGYSFLLLGRGKKKRRQIMPKNIKSGKVIWFNELEGRGYIKQSDGHRVYVYYSAIQMDGFKTLKKDQPVSYTLYEGDKFLQADKVFIV